jgi:hypothetical protein
MTAGCLVPCPSCRGRGRKFVFLRRSVAVAGGAAESALLRRLTEPCLACGGKGKVARPADTGANGSGASS